MYKSDRKPPVTFINLINFVAGSMVQCASEFYPISTLWRLRRQRFPLLVFEFISNGTLYKNLHVEAPRSISCKDRLRIVVETSIRALAYLHSFSLNILCDDDLSFNVHSSQERIYTSVQGA
ncbi:hypothetical protein U9M48_002461 [Paspalum notatum var. saurae]|uniref:Protein kinase domain-containing protein n=1 Tax=Paspalum notatum var. saurae TaxID=547442 RepID=A0AAQ3PQN3_PASNO